MELLTPEAAKKARAKERRRQHYLNNREAVKKQVAAYRKRMEAENPNWRRDQYARRREHELDYIRKRRGELPEKHMLWIARSRARKKGVPCTIDVSDIVIPETCPVLGIKLMAGSRASKDNSPSLDRLVPHLGYVPGNITVISDRANRIKNNATVDEIGLLYTWMLKQQTIH